MGTPNGQPVYLKFDCEKGPKVTAGTLVSNLGTVIYQLR
jgi:hypothetical protein